MQDLSYDSDNINFELNRFLNITTRFHHTCESLTGLLFTDNFSESCQ